MYGQVTISRTISVQGTFPLRWSQHQLPPCESHLTLLFNIVTFTKRLVKRVSQVSCRYPQANNNVKWWSEASRSMAKSICDEGQNCSQHKVREIWIPWRKTWVQKPASCSIKSSVQENPSSNSCRQTHMWVFDHSWVCGSSLVFWFLYSSFWSLWPSHCSLLGDLYWWQGIYILLSSISVWMKVLYSY